MGSILPDARIISGQYTAAATDSLLLCDVRTGPCRITLTPKSESKKGDVFIIKHYMGDVTTNNITVVSAAGAPIDSSDELSMYNTNQCVWLAYIPDRWVILTWV